MSNVQLPVAHETVLTDPAVELLVAMVVKPDVELQTVVVMCDSQRRGRGIFHVTGAGVNATADVVDVARGVNKLVNPEGVLLVTVVVKGVALPMQEYSVTP